MTLKECLESGKRFRRIETNSGVAWHPVNCARVWSVEDVLAEDWEIEEELPDVTVVEIIRLIEDVRAYTKIGTEFGPQYYLRNLTSGAYK